MLDAASPSDVGVGVEEAPSDAPRPGARWARIAAATLVVHLLAGLVLFVGYDPLNLTTNDVAPPTTVDQSPDVGARSSEADAAPHEPTPDAAAARPGPANTGVIDEGALTVMTADDVELLMRDGAVIEDVFIHGGPIDLLADDVTIRNFRVDARGADYGFRAVDGAVGIVLEDGEIFGARSAAIYGMGFTARRLDIHDSRNDGIKAQGTGGPVLVERSWIHHIGTGQGAHADGNQTRSSTSPIVFRENYCDLPVTTPPPYKSNACFMVGTAEGPTSGFLIEKNWLNGGNYTIFAAPDASVRVRDNLFGRDVRYGLRSGSFAEWSGNRWEDTGEAIP